VGRDRSGVPVVLALIGIFFKFLAMPIWQANNRPSRVAAVVRKIGSGKVWQIPISSIARHDNGIPVGYM
jgi:hypothetical protein